MNRTKFNRFFGKRFFQDERYRFMGEDGSMGFKTGLVYRLTMKGMPLPDKRINNARLIVTDGHRWCPYSSMETFNKNWSAVSETREKQDG
jgi:hypothetical protein